MVLGIVAAYLATGVLLAFGIWLFVRWNVHKGVLSKDDAALRPLAPGLTAAAVLWPVFLWGILFQYP